MAILYSILGSIDLIRATVQDRYGNEVYITEERWQHIITGHRDMENNFEYLLKTLRTGKRRRDHENPSKFLYTKKFKHLPPQTALLVVVKFGHMQAAKRNIPNNFVLSAYLIHVK